MALDKATLQVEATTCGLATTYRKPAKYGGGLDEIGAAELQRRIWAYRSYGDALKTDGGCPSIFGRVKRAKGGRNDVHGSPVMGTEGKTAFWFNAETPAPVTLADAVDGTDINGDSAEDPEMKPEIKPAPVNAGASDAELMIGMIQRIAGSAVTAESVREIVAKEMAKLRAEISERAPLATTFTFTPPTGSGKEIKGPIPAKMKTVLALASMRRNVMLVGPAGCGKTHLAHMVADALRFSFGFISCSAGMSEGSLLGRMLPVGEGGRFEYQSSRFVDAYENGGVFLFDEIDAADANVLIVINAALANGSLALPSRTQNPVALRHKDFIFMGAANTFGQGATRVYVGRNQLDLATIDRQSIVEMGYDANVEKALIDAETLAWGLGVRKKINTCAMRRIMSTRTLIRMSEERKAGESMRAGDASECEMLWSQVKARALAGWSRDELTKIGE